MNSYHLSHHAEATPDKLAYRFVPSGVSATFAELDAKSNQVAHLMRRSGLTRNDVIAILLENQPAYYEIAWAADRAGLYYTGISTRLTADEVGYILRDSGARILFVSHALADVGTAALAQCPGCIGMVVGGPAEGLEDYAALVEREPTTRIVDESMGAAMLYSSGTTGRPKGVKFALPEIALGEIDPLTSLCRDAFSFRPDAVYLSPAPMYHSAPLRISMSAQRIGATVVVLEKFDPVLALATIERERITHSQWVPTHFVRMLKMPEGDRLRYDLSSHEFAVHAAAPCPVPIKKAMLEWWGPIIYEYYSGTEFNGMTFVSPDEWLARPGTVGRPIFGTVHVMADDGETPLGPRSEGLIYFEGGTRFSYHNDPEKTATSYNSRGWSTLGDIGWTDEAGYLYLTDRKSFLIISGGVNIYPQEIEDAIVAHPRVADAAVIGAPDEDLGERLVAVVQPLAWADAGPDLADDIRASLAPHLSPLKIPKQIDFMQELPRHPTGKLYKRLLRDRYWAAPTGVAPNR